MGTNFYVRIKRKDQEEPEKVHIGKRSYGWKFLFACNPKYYEPTRKSINRFLKLHKNEFYDEYGDLQDIDEFWRNTVDGSSGGIDSKEYYRPIIERGEKVYDWEWEWPMKEFYSDDLRFTPDPDFS